MRCLNIKMCAQFCVVGFFLLKSRAFCSLAGLQKGKKFVFPHPPVYLGPFICIHIPSSQVWRALVAAEGPEESSSLRSICQKCELDRTNQISTLSSLSKFFSPSLLFVPGIAFPVPHQWAGVPVMAQTMKEQKNYFKACQPFQICCMYNMIYVVFIFEYI